MALLVSDRVEPCGLQIPQVEAVEHVEILLLKSSQCLPTKLFLKAINTCPMFGYVRKVECVGCKLSMESCNHFCQRQPTRQIVFGRRFGYQLLELFGITGLEGLNPSKVLANVIGKRLSCLVEKLRQMASRNDLWRCQNAVMLFGPLDQHLQQNVFPLGHQAWPHRHQTGLVCQDCRSDPQGVPLRRQDQDDSNSRRLG